MTLRFTVGNFPVDSGLNDSTGLPWSCLVQPFAYDEEKELSAKKLVSANVVARCGECFAYINCFCKMDAYRWICAMCERTNMFTKEERQRYGSHTLQTQCEELNEGMVEFDLPASPNGDADAEVYTRPVFIAVVDLSANEEFLELVKSALLAALEALSPATLFGLVTVCHKLGMYDLQGTVPVVKYAPIPAAPEAAFPVNLEDVMQLQSMLVPVETHKERIASVLESLHPFVPWDSSGRVSFSDQDKREEAVRINNRGLGAALDAILKYLVAGQAANFVTARLFVFLSGPPDYGAGALDSARYGEQYSFKGEDADKALLQEQTSFYRDLAALAVQAGASVDLCAIADEYVDLASLKFLSTQSGGHVLLYQSTEDATLPQDLYRMLSRPQAFNVALRLRTTPEFSVTDGYGPFFLDAEYDNLYHIISCDPYDTFTFDFDFVGTQSFTPSLDTPPLVQLAFQYSVLLPVEEPRPAGAPSTPTAPPTPPTPAAMNGSGTSRHCHVLRRRLRLRTVRLGIARTAGEVYEACDPEAVLTSLTHKIIKACIEEGVREGRLLLRDWLVVLTAQYNTVLRLMEDEGAAPDVSFSLCPQLQPLPRLVFALLRSPLLHTHEEGVHPDYRVYLQCMFSSLEPSSLLRAVYPVLSSYVTPDKQAFPRHSLSRAAIVTSGSPIFLLDSFTTLVVYYTATAGAGGELPFPPPHNSLLRNTINRLKQDRTITPRLVMVRGGHDNVEVFERFLLEEQDVEGSKGPAAGMGFVAFLESTAVDVRAYVKSSA